ncbi:uncharacterized protein LOC111705088 [Eurytemora carolleeae]|uniref:uncharacterized protein LOC111705088 n=1 Tax=Eurytemora carolleeae TaxID=1294199 RepID=UPI000C75ADCD|nr:uncharacterized protein LOC111705088 [Eurytemora carolleeae]|eukprot:XP_023333296.1 uncharacterized protein LOC111705088 [Eurytemora affinis]
MVNYLINKGAKVYYENNDVSCPLQLACKIPLLKESGKEIASLLVTHGANLEYRDRALRNTLFWVVYNNSRDLAYHIIQSGARIQPWSWVEKEYLPQQIRQDRLLTDLIDSSSSQPQKLVLITICRIRYILSRSVGGKSILKRIEELPVGLEIKKILRLESATSRRKEDIKKLHRLCSETQV